MSKEKPIRKKLIEVALPLEAINKEALHRKQKAPKGFPTSIHKYWAQRPIAICIAVLFAQLVDDPSAWPDRFNGEEAQEVERQRLFRVIEQLVLWENATNEDVLNSARWEIARSVAWGLGEMPPKRSDGKAILAYLQEKAPPVYDPFCGGGSIPLEAQRLGLRSYGADLNPVAVLISKALVEIPPKFAGQPPINPQSREKLSRASSWSGRGAQGLAEDVRYYGNYMRARAIEELGSIYPPVEIDEDIIRIQPKLEALRGQRLPAVAWIWARTVASPDPVAKGQHVPLATTFVLSLRESAKVWIEAVLDSESSGGYRFEVKSGTPSREVWSKANKGTKSSRGANFTCVLTSNPIPSDYIKSEGKAGRMGQRLLAIVADSPLGRIYLPPTRLQEQVAQDCRPNWEPELATSTHPQYMGTVGYGLETFADLFTSRQLKGLTTFYDLVQEARNQAIADALTAGFEAGDRLANGGSGANAYGDAVATYLAFAVDRMAFYGSNLVGWLPKDNALGKTMPRQAMAMSWDFAEGNLIGKSSADITTATRSIAHCLDATSALPLTSHILQNSAFKPLDISGALISTDPPYYDNVPYADLSDFFYVWLRRSLRTVWPGLFETVSVPKSEELVANHQRQGGKEESEKFFENGMREALKSMHSVSSQDYPSCIYYAFKQSETTGDGASSTGWSTFLQSVFDSGLVIDGTWPMRTESAGRIRGLGSNALASSIVLVCRKRSQTAPVTTRAAFLTALRRELPAALKLLQAGNVAPVDLAQASIGPGMGIFTRHSKVLEADDSAMSVKTALQLINQALDDYLSEQESEYDPQTRFAITWFDTHGMDGSAYGDAEILAKARNVAVSGVADAGLLESKGGKVRLLKRTEMDANWDPLTDKTPTVWECAQHLIRVLEADGEAVAAGLLAKLGSRADATRDLAYRLYQICERKKWADEARAYNGLVVAWPELQKLASQQSSAATPAPAQATLI